MPKPNSKENKLLLNLRRCLWNNSLAEKEPTKLTRKRTSQLILSTSFLDSTNRNILTDIWKTSLSRNKLWQVRMEFLILKSSQGWWWYILKNLTKRILNTRNHTREQQKKRRLMFRKLNLPRQRLKFDQRYRRSALKLKLSSRKMPQTRLNLKYIRRLLLLMLMSKRDLLLDILVV